MLAPRHEATDTTAKLMLVALSFAWGLTWPAMRIALDEIPPFSMRVVTLGLGARRADVVREAAGALARARRLEEPRCISSSPACSMSLSFSLLSVIAMMFAATGRVAMLVLHDADLGGAVRMVVLGERLTRLRASSRSTLCVAGMAILIWPLAQTTALRSAC